MGQDLMVAAEQELGLVGAKVGSVGLEIDPDMEFDRWEQIGTLLGKIEGSVAWWIGDWVNFGEAAYGEMYAQAIEVTGLDYGRLRNIASVCRNVELSRRRDKLTFYHHELVAKMDPAKQGEWLDKAEASHLSGRSLREEIRDAGMLPAPAAQPEWTGTPEEQLRQAIAERETLEAERDAAEQTARAWQERAQTALVATGEMVRCPRCGELTERDKAINPPIDVDAEEDDDGE